MLGLSPAALPVDTPGGARRRSAGWIERALARLGYPGFAYLRPSGPKHNPADILLRALGSDVLDARLVEALPWVLLRFEGLDHDALVDTAKLENLQNRLGFLVALASEVAERHAGWAARLPELRRLQERLEPARLACEGTLGAVPRCERMRTWLRRNRSESAAHWNLLTDLRVEHLAYADDDPGAVVELPR